MSYVIKTKEDLKKLSEYLKFINTSKIDKDVISDILESLLPKKESELLVDYKINETSNIKEPAFYVPLFNTIYITLDKLKKWIELNFKDFCDVNNTENEQLKLYLLLFLLLHEIEHSYQGLLRLNGVEAPNKLVKDGYSTFMNLLVSGNKTKINPVKRIVRDIRLSKYYGKKDYYVLERNANLEASMTLVSLAQFTGDKEIEKIFYDMTKAYSILGYEENKFGCMLQTYKDLLYYSRYKKIDKSDINDDDRIRYGLEISNDKRIELLKIGSLAYNRVFR